MAAEGAEMVKKKKRWKARNEGFYVRLWSMKMGPLHLISAPRLRKRDYLMCYKFGATCPAWQKCLPYL